MNNRLSSLKHKIMTNWLEDNIEVKWYIINLESKLVFTLAIHIQFTQCDAALSPHLFLHTLMSVCFTLSDLCKMCISLLTKQPYNINEEIYVLFYDWTFNLKSMQRLSGVSFHWHNCTLTLTVYVRLASGGARQRERVKGKGEAEENGELHYINIV